MSEPTNQNPEPSTTGHANASGISFHLLPDLNRVSVRNNGIEIALIGQCNRPNRGAGIIVYSSLPLGAFPYRDRIASANAIEVQIG